MQINLRRILCIALLLFLFTEGVGAQSNMIVQLGNPDLTSFPTIAAFLDVHDSQGDFVHNLSPEQVTILEDGNQSQIDQIEEIHAGVQAVVAINPGPSFAIRNFQAVSRYDQVKEALKNWAKSRAGTTTDDLSLIITNGSTISHTSDPLQFLNSLETDQLDPRDSEPSIDTLAQAIRLASDPTPRQGMGKAVLFITSEIEGEIEQPLKDIMDQARQEGITISIWNVGSSGGLINQATENLIALATSTGGQVINFSGEETLPNPEEHLDSMRHIYQIGYQSKVGLSGEHELAAQVQIGDEAVISNTQVFQVDLKPPEPAFISPPITIDRQFENGEVLSQDTVIADGANPADMLSPREVTLLVVFDFPDGLKRELVSSALVVDGVTIAENLTPPFDQFTWDLQNYVQSSSHRLQVRATDTLGLTGTSIEVPVEIRVQNLEADPWFVLRSNLTIIALLLVVLIGGFIFLVLVLGGRLRPTAQLAAGKAMFQTGKSKKSPIEFNDRSQTHSGWASRVQQPNDTAATDALAYLQRMTEGETPSKEPPFPITSSELLIGSDPMRSTFIIKETCIDGLHARLTCEPDERFQLVDEGSIAGTWLNYSPIPIEGVKLQNGDMIHFGRIGFRFSIRKTSQILKPAVILEKRPEKEEHKEETDVEGSAQ